MPEVKSPTGDADTSQTFQPISGVCTQCQGAGHIIAAQPHASAPYLRQLPRPLGVCGRCFGTGMESTAALALEKPGDDFLYLSFMHDGWKGTEQTQAEIAHLQAGVSHWQEADPNPTREGLAKVFAGIGMNAAQATQAAQVAAGYAGLK